MRHYIYRTGTRLYVFKKQVVTAILTLSYSVARTGAFSVHILNLAPIDITSHQELVRCSMSTSNPSLFTISFQFILVTMCFYGPCLFAVKCSIFLLFLTVFGELRWVRLLVWLGLLTTGLLYTAAIVVFTVSCSPRGTENHFMSVNKPRCRSWCIEYSLVMTSFSIVSDFYLFILPIPAVLGLHMRIGKKFGILAIFMTGLW